ncbi:uncharacterized protein LAJ45_11208 [Morchella importuna]|uniref:uncharacterized protein n=1 Tax=Morchella importuna TaxID=1174673 RepID=UPI001E8DB2F5|nr:uncharacterized protein LAJ45_11208 [Morchella importuna]KAH8144773.1 hypothetical protein LAJ45_11208 [Morchella importuna]
MAAGYELTGGNVVRSVERRIPQSRRCDKVCKIFRDDLTLDNLSRAQLVGMCRYMNLNTFGTDAILRYNIRHRMRQIKRDDRAISYEGHGLPSTLLVLSNAFMYQGKESEIESHYDALVAVLSSIPEELYHEIELEVNTAEGAATNKQRLEVLREQQELIEEENEQRSAGESASKRNVKDDQDIDEKEDDKRTPDEEASKRTVG